MEKTLLLYYSADGVDSIPFPSEAEQGFAASFTYDAKRMGGAPTISFTIKHTICLDNLWNNSVYTEFNGEKYYINNVPSSRYDNSDSRYIHDVVAVSERCVLDNVYFFDVVAGDTENDKPVSNSSNVVFFGDIREFARRLQLSLNYSHIDYTVVVDDNVHTDAKLMSFNDRFFSDVLQEIYNTFEVPYYFDGRTIHIGAVETEIDEVFEYGIDSSLISIQKQNANYKIVNRCTGDGSDSNIPYYYPNQSPYGKLNALYNGRIDVNVNIYDWAKFSKYGPSSILTYETNNNAAGATIKIASLSDFEQVSVSRTGQILGQSIYTWSGKCQIKIDSAQQYVYLSFGFNEITGGSIGFSILNDEGIEVAQTYFPSASGVKLSYGSYELRINISVGNRPNADKEYVQSVAYADVSTANVVNESSWRLNGEKNISLSNMGISLIGTPKNGDKITFVVAEGRIPIVGRLMPSIYRESRGAERFYNALNNVYDIPGGNGAKYIFSNPYVVGNPREHIVHFEDIKPTIKDMVNAKGERMDMFVDFAYDDNDNDEVGDDGNYEHPYFYAKLRKFDGANGFNLFAHAIEGNGMTIAMTSGSCGACEWKIGVDENSLQNPVQVYEKDTTDVNGVFHPAGSLKRNDNGDVIRKGVPQSIQNDTSKNEVWIALEKDQNTFGVLMPNAANNYRPAVGDTFVILHISLPEAYILAAEQKLTESIIKYMSENNDDKFNFSIKFSRIFLAENPNVLRDLTENSKIKIRYNNNVYSLYVSSYSYKMSDTDALPEVTVQITDTVTVNRSVLQNTIEGLRNSEHHATYVSESIGGNAQLNAGREVITGSKNLSQEIYELGQRHFVSKEVADAADGIKTFRDDVFIEKNISSNGFERGTFAGSGWGIYKDEQGGYAVAEFDKLIVRQELEINELKINQSTYEKGSQVFSSGGCVVKSVEEYPDFYRCYFDNKNGTFFSGFVVGDIVYCQRFNESYSNIVKHYRRAVVGVSASYVDLSKGDAFGAGTPTDGDSIIQFGNIADTNRQYVIIRDVVGGGYERMLSGLNSVSSSGVEYYFAGRMEGNTPRWFVGNNNQFIEYKDGHLQIKADVTIGANSDLSASEEFKKLQDDIKGLQNQIDGKVEAFFYNYDPKLDNLPASEWTTDAIKEEHLNDTFTNIESGQSWRWLLKDGVYQWVAISDTQALQMAQDALNIANGKVTIFTETPTPPYKVKDLWFQGEGGNTMRCVKARNEQESFNASDWVKADDYKDFASSVAGDAEQNAKDYADSQISSYDLTIKYLKDAFNQGSVLDVNGVTLSALVGVKDKDGKVVAGLYGGGSVKLNDEGYADSTHKAMLLFSGIEGVDKPETYKTAIFEDGFLQSTYFATAKGGKRVEIFGNELKVYGDDTNNSVLSISYDSTGKPRLQYTDKSGNVAWYLSDSGISTSYTVKQVDDLVAKYILKDTAQTISARHNFSDGLQIGGITIRKSQDGTVYIDGNLVIKGAMTMFGTDATVAQSIWASIPFDSTMKWDGSKWSVDGGSGSGSVDDSRVNVLISEYLTKNSYATQSWVQSQGYLTTHQSLSHLLTKTDAANTYQTIINSSNKIAYSNISGTPDLSVYALKTAIPSLSGYATEQWVGDNYLPSANFTKVNIKSTLGISDWALAATKPSYTAAEVGALSTSGGFVSSDDYQPLFVNSNFSSGIEDVRIAIAHNWNVKGLFNWESNGVGLRMYNTTCGSAIGIKDDGTPYFDSYELIHLGNIGSYNAGSANRLRAIVADEGRGNLNDILEGGGIVYNYSHLEYWENAPYGASYGSCAQFTSARDNCSYLAGQLFWDINHDSTTDTTRNLWWRAADINRWTNSKWHQIAFTDSNVASATKLQTPRTIWGQSFDGTADVSGTIKSVDVIRNARSNWIIGEASLDGEVHIGSASFAQARTLYNANGMLSLLANGTFRLLRREDTPPLMHSILTYEAAPYGLLTRINTDGSVSLQAQRETNDAECFRLLLNPLGGNVAIGGTTADAKLHVHGDVKVTGHLGLATGFDLGGVNAFLLSGNNIYVGSKWYNTILRGSILDFVVGDTTAMQISADGNTTINGNLLTTGAITMFSQLSMKNVIDYDGLSLAQLAQIRPARFTWKDNRDNRTHVGVIADYIQPILPEVVYETVNKELTVDYGSAAFYIGASLIKPVIDHEKRIAELEREVEYLREGNRQLRAN